MVGLGLWVSKRNTQGSWVGEVSQSAARLALKELRDT